MKANWSSASSTLPVDASTIVANAPSATPSTLLRWLSVMMSSRDDSAGPTSPAYQRRQRGGVAHRHVTCQLRAANGRGEHGRFVAGREEADHSPEGEQRLPITAQGIQRDVVQRGEHAGHVAGHLGAHGAGHRDETIGTRVSRRLELGRPDHERRQLR